MDNRRVFRSYKEKVKDSSTPYARPSNGLFSKMKLFLTGASLWSQHENTIQNDQIKDNTSPVDVEKNESSIKPFSFPEPDSTIFKTPLKSTSNLTKAPNQMLSSFFQEKGDRPLTDVEYEGIVSLLTKSNSASNTPNHSVYRGDGVSKQFESIENSKDLGNKEADTSAFKMSGSNLFVTPYSQKTLKNTSSNDHVFSTPEYKPVYHAINENFNTKNVPSVKRVYQFSGLPSPYRTRIRAPSLSSRPKNPTKNSPSITKSPFAQKTTSRPMSNAANSLLSILDDNARSGEDIEMRDTSNDRNINIQQFSNPYHRPLSVKKPRSQDSNNSQSDINASTPIKKTNTLLSANDINKTISYDKSEELPKETKSSIIKEVSTNNQSSSSSSQIVGKLGFNSNTNKLNCNVPKDGQKLANKNINANIDSNSDKSTPVDKFSNNQFQPKTNSFSFGKITKPHIDSNPVYNNANKDMEFIFPEIVQTEVNLDCNKFEQYKHLFKF